jgi:hypothetical protein
MKLMRCIYTVFHEGVAGCQQCRFYLITMVCATGLPVGQQALLLSHAVLCVMKTVFAAGAPGRPSVQAEHDSIKLYFFCEEESLSDCIQSACSVHLDDLTMFHCQ